MVNVLIFSKGILNQPYLFRFLTEYELRAYSFFRKNHAVKVLGWGLRPSTRKAREYAKKHQLPYIALEDGFIRSLGLGVEGYPPFSLVVDDIGIYYDTTRPSRLERLILAAELTAEQQAVAKKAMLLISENRLSKYNHASDLAEKLAKPMVLVIDQTFGDMAVKYGQADQSHFQQMLDCAVAENPTAEIWVKTHPDVISGKKQGYLTQFATNQRNIRLFSQDVNPISLLQAAEKVYCVTSQMGFEALLVGKAVVTFGVPWFAGWGLTDDRHPNIKALVSSPRRQCRSLEQLFFAAYWQYSRYLNPNTHQQGTLFDVIDYVVQAKRQQQFVQGELYCIGMSLWKRAVIKPFFRFPACRLHFVPSVARLQKILSNKPLAQVKLLVWSEGKAEVLAFAKQYQLPVLRMEDGFIRSVGLGSNLVAPLSLVIDDRGIYFNPQTPSRLEQILQNKSFSENELCRAERLRQALITQHIAKYNVGRAEMTFESNGRKKILVVGQVEDDASIRLGSPQIHDNLTLLKTVRAANPNAYIIYKPHPDVVSGNRKGAIQAVGFADNIAENANILDCIHQVDEVHTMTSLAGFEALLRHKTVHCYGLPFYAGWGLTVDHLAVPRRTRRLTLHQLIIGTLIEYPLYLDMEQNRLVNVERAITLLQQQKQQLRNTGIRRPWLLKQVGKIHRLYRALLD